MLGISGHNFDEVFSSHRNNLIAQFLRICAINSAVSANLAVKCPGLLVDFVHCLYRDISPASIIIPAGVWDIIESICQNRTISVVHLEETKIYAPILSQLLQFICLSCREDSKLTLSFEMLQFCLEKSKANFITRNDE